MRAISKIFFFAGLLQLPLLLHAQNDTTKSDLMDMLNDGNASVHTPVTATFKATRIINNSSIEQTGKGVMDFRIGHRFGVINGGIKEFFGLDGAVTQLAFDYGVTKGLTVGVSRSTYNKEYEGYLKARLLTQTEDGHIPVSIAYVGGMTIASAPQTSLGIPDDVDFAFSNRLSYVHQLLIARKFSSAFSLQLMPTLIHYNMVDYDVDPNNVFAVGVGGRVRLSNRLSLNGEYIFQIPGTDRTNTTNSLSVGLDIETGGHVFQLLFTNSTGMSEPAFVGQTTDKWEKGRFHFGFNISRIFQIVHPKEFEGSRNSIY